MRRRVSRGFLTIFFLQFIGIAQCYLRHWNIVEEFFRTNSKELTEGAK